MKRKLRIYIAGPYTKPDPCENTNRTIQAAEEVVKLGHIPWIPHLNLLWHIVVPHPPEFWYAYDLEWLETCDALLRLPGESPGADREVAFADEHGIPTVYTLGDLKLLINILMREGTA